MDTTDLRSRLLELIDETPRSDEESYLLWTSKVAHLLRLGFGSDSPQLHDFTRASKVRKPRMSSGTVYYDKLRTEAVSRGKATMKGAVFALETASTHNPLDDSSVDPELWQHVIGLVNNEDWGKIPSAVVIFVEDKVRTWAEDPPDKNGGSLIGKGLYNRAFADDGVLRLGKQGSEWEGWKMLGSGLSQAIGNVDRHRIQQRKDVKRYALGVLGLASLLLTQLRYERGDVIDEIEIIRPVSN
ncbi:hypothetical protein I2485_15280 [Nesterenkonia sp. E16_7]|uniref:TIGR02391 family protein n=1 Tax=unclassified Nesterenkonia TaxID=2629769 RepID=UPI001A91BB01|nr:MULTISPECIES: TIGR02391 family protein [unclassified Nesterenkonia]MBO0596806.1 hypothetical protein [Nesterenkonia sp. E16_10]MBO0600011.1 hypothetical protein [Nesterenkonia sp. E16_7]